MPVSMSTGYHFCSMRLDHESLCRIWISSQHSRMEWIYSSNLFLVICLLFAAPGRCPGCTGESVQCDKDQYLRGRRCVLCASCDVNKKLVQVEDCSLSTPRVCHCSKGYYCKEAQSYTCLFSCIHCPDGTFSNRTSLANRKETCIPHTNCESKGLVIGTNGSHTEDNVCVTPPVTPSPIIGAPKSKRQTAEQSTETGVTNQVSADTTTTQKGHPLVHSKETLTPTRSADTTTQDGHPLVISEETLTPSPSADTTITQEGHPLVISEVTLTSNVSTVQLLTAAQPEASVRPIHTWSSVPAPLTRTPQPTRGSTALPPSTMSILLSKPSETQTGFPRGQAYTALPISESDSQRHLWLVVLILFLAVVFYCLWLKAKALRKKRKFIECASLGECKEASKGSYNVYVPQQQPEQAKASDTISSGTQRVEWQVPVKRESDCLQREAAATAASASAAAAPAPATQVHPGQGPASVQHVTMDKSGKGEGISNTVGSIFIYSPGMVVLGTNASERREEVRQEGEDHHLHQHHHHQQQPPPPPPPLAGVPQQESLDSFSCSSEETVALSTQEEDSDKDLSYPIPASDK